MFSIERLHLHDIAFVIRMSRERGSALGSRMGTETTFDDEARE